MDVVDHDAFRVERALGNSKFEGHRLAAEPFVVLSEHRDLEHPFFTCPLFATASSKKQWEQLLLGVSRLPTIGTTMLFGVTETVFIGLADTSKDVCTCQSRC